MEKQVLIAIFIEILCLKNTTKFEKTAKVREKEPRYFKLQISYKIIAKSIAI